MAARCAATGDIERAPARALGSVGAICPFQSRWRQATNHPRRERTPAPKPSGLWLPMQHAGRRASLHSEIGSDVNDALMMVKIADDRQI